MSPHAVRIVVGCLAASLAFTYQMPVELPLPPSIVPTKPISRPNVPQGTELLPDENNISHDHWGEILSMSAETIWALYFRSGFRPHLEAIASIFGLWILNQLV